MGVASPHRRSFVIGAVLLLRWEALSEVGLFDERFFLYAEETDWQRRALASAGRRRCARSVVARHRGAGTSTDPLRREVLFHAAQETYIRKWHGVAGWWSYRTAACLGATAVRLSLAGERRAEAVEAGAPLPARPSPVRSARRRLTVPSVVHVVTTDNFAGVERYVCDVAPRPSTRGWETAVVGGNAERMRGDAR